MTHMLCITVELDGDTPEDDVRYLAAKMRRDLQAMLPDAAVTVKAGAHQVFWYDDVREHSVRV